MLPHRAFHFVRHGETEWNRLGRLQGRSDIPLNAHGEAQAAFLRPQLKPYGFRSIAASPLLRARRTAEILNAELDLPIHFIDALMEIDVGPYAGTSDGAWLPGWRKGEAVDGVEHLAAFARRVGAGISAALALQGPVLIVAHGGLIWALEHLLKLQEKGLDIPNTALVHFQPPASPQEYWRMATLFEPEPA